MIQVGDSRELMTHVEDESVDFICTDPLYENMDDYEWLSREGMRVLKPDSACLAFCAIGSIPDVHDAMRRGGLTYRWRFIVRPVFAKEFNGRLMVCTQECVWYEKGRSKPLQSIFDFDMSIKKGSYIVKDKSARKVANWGKGHNVLSRYIATFCPPDGLVLDPFCGSGSVPMAARQMGRAWLAFEQDKDVAAQAMINIENTQAPLGLVFEE
jgi:site-specific DNA-methyltransferase (adenine-specific)